LVRSILWLMACASLAAAGCKKKGDEAEAESAAAPEPAAGKAAAGQGRPAAAKLPLESYPATADGLRDLAADLVRVKMAEPARAASAAATVLTLPAPEAWFARVFGPEVGKHLAAEYAIYGHGVDQFPKMIAAQGTRHDRKTFLAEKHESREDPAATGLQARTMAAMLEPTPLYSLRMTGPGETDFVLYSFIHDGTTFRYVGRLTHLDGKRPAKEELAALEKRQRDAK
jgi:hypothetical protein